MKNEEKTHLGEENKIFWTENANMKALIFVHLSSGSVSRELGCLAWNIW